MSVTAMSDRRATIAVVYLARGQDEDWIGSFRRFLTSYRKYPPGRDHTLYIVYKGFQSSGDLTRARKLFSGVEGRAIKTDDSGLDIGAYIVAVSEIAEDYACFLNTHSELLAAGWLEKLTLHVCRQDVGMVGTTGSFESLAMLGPHFHSFPNVHVRSNGFVMQCELLRFLLGGAVIRNKHDAFLIESGPNSLTRQILTRGLDVLIVGRNGRGYPPRWWPSSHTFRQGRQENLLIGDNQTRAYMAASWNVKHTMVENTWGRYLNPNIACDLR